MQGFIFYNDLYDPISQRPKGENVLSRIEFPFEYF
jgi:hypothetical protein